MWIKDKTLTILVKREYGFVPFGDNTYKKQLLRKKKVVVLINKGSASSTELVAAAIKDYKSATLMGETTFGKGVSQTIHFVLGAVLSYTSMHFISPHGNIINDNGVSPDITVGMTFEDFLNNNDTQLKAAIKFLKDK
jgi:carboxyl-terminal processing protease